VPPLQLVLCIARGQGRLPHAVSSWPTCTVPVQCLRQGHIICAIETAHESSQLYDQHPILPVSCLHLVFTCATMSFYRVNPSEHGVSCKADLFVEYKSVWTKQTYIPCSLFSTHALCVLRQSGAVCHASLFWVLRHNLIQIRHRRSWATTCNGMCSKWSLYYILVIGPQVQLQSLPSELLRFDLSVLRLTQKPTNVLLRVSHHPVPNRTEEKERSHELCERHLCTSPHLCAHCLINIMLVFTTKPLQHLLVTVQIC